jgi:ribosomal protein S18 acetylase RimI-like enzyme
VNQKELPVPKKGSETMIDKMVRKMLGVGNTSDANQFEVCNITPELVSSVLQIERAIFRDPYTYQSINYLVDRFTPVSMWCVRLDDRTAGGYVLVKNDKPRSAQILAIGVDSTCRYAGIGRTLVDFVCRRVAPGKIILAAAPESRLESQQFFKACGFGCISTFSRYYSDGGSALIFQRRPSKKHKPFYSGWQRNIHGTMQPRVAPGSR